MRKKKNGVVLWCKFCEERFESTQPKAVFCSELCRKRHWRIHAIKSGKIKLKGGKRGRPNTTQQ